MSKAITVIGDREYEHNLPRCTLGNHCQMCLVHPLTKHENELYCWDLGTGRHVSCYTELSIGGVPYPSAGFEAATSLRDANIRKWFT